MTEPKTKGLNLQLDVDMHQQLREVADHFGASLAGTVMRYIRIGLEADASTIRRERAGQHGGGTSG